MTTVILVIAVLFITFLARLSAAESGASVVDSDYIEELDPLAKMPTYDPEDDISMIDIHTQRIPNVLAFTPWDQDE